MIFSYTWDPSGAGKIQAPGGTRPPLGIVKMAAPGQTTYTDSKTRYFGDQGSGQVAPEFPSIQDRKGTRQVLFCIVFYG